MIRRLFIAVWPPAEVLAGLDELAHPDVEGLRWTSRERRHVTLRFLGSADDEATEAASRGLRSRPLVAPDIRLGPAVSRFGNGVVQVPAHGLDALASAVVDATAHVGRPPEQRPFAGHLTLARVTTRRGGHVDLRGVVGAAIDVGWRACSLTLVASRLAPGGAAYDVLESIDLGR